MSKLRHSCHCFTKHTKFVQDMYGFAPDEWQAMELFKISKDHSRADLLLVTRATKLGVSHLPDLTINTRFLEERTN